MAGAAAHESRTSVRRIHFQRGRSYPRQNLRSWHSKPHRARAQKTRSCAGEDGEAVRPSALLFLSVDSVNPGHHDACMRTTLTLDPDVAAKAKKGAAKLGKPFKEVINSALRAGLEQVLNPPASKPYRTKARPLGLRAGLNYDNVGELLARGEGEDHG